MQFMIYFDREKHIHTGLKGDSVCDNRLGSTGLQFCLSWQRLTCSEDFLCMRPPLFLTYSCILDILCSFILRYL